MSQSLRDNKAGFRVLVAGAVLQLFLGILYVWSVFVLPVSESLAWAVDSVKLTSSYMLCCFVLGILLGGRLQPKVGAQRVSLVGGLLMAGGMLASSFVTPSMPWLLYVTYGVAGGLGVGMAYNAAISTAQQWFPQKRGLATGISVCAFGLSTVLFAPVVEALIQRTSVAATFRILAVVYAVVVLLLFRYIKLPEATAGGSGAALSGHQYTTGEMLKTPTFYFITIAMMCGTAAFFILNPSLKTLAMERGFSAAMGTTLVMITGIANAMGRLCVPMLSDRIGRERAAMLIHVLTAVCIVLLIFLTGIPFIAAVAVIAFCYGGYSGIYPLITADHFGMKHLGANYGAVMVGFAISALFFPMILSPLPEATRFIALGVLAAIGAPLLALAAKKNAQRSAAA